ncbi:hypothetical protein IFM89_004472 [Coptis chinensis]|uniref:non-specific serine/threonine protein kinase n=1 Tax=Coptis chinensis TaxID=261450 RepID=A0A835GW82_9MAGN|nr:hypothetical protein IFM89_004472 [Coptis chinensis]
MAEIYKATWNFAPSFMIGQGDFGTVYKGRLDDGTFVAVKRAEKNVYDKHLGVEFQSEIKMLARVEHLNLVRFHGYLENEDEKFVVEEYVPNGTLRERLDCLDGNILDLAARLDIAIDVAHAVTYLHMYTGTDHPIIHRDIKSSNILLTENLQAKVADFGFARLAADSDTGATHVSTQVKGTAGYLDPEYLRTYQLTEKSDVYSFGVLLVELVSGRRPIEPKRELKERITTRWSMKKFTDGDGILTLDPMLLRNPSTNLAVEKILELALQCLAPTRQGRPSMRRCAEILCSVRKDFRELSASNLRPLSSLSQRELVRSGSYLDIPSVQNKCLTSPSLIVCEKHGAKRTCIAVGDDKEDRFSDDDIAIEILSRLPMESIYDFKCGLHYCPCENYIDSEVVDYISTGKKGRHATSKNILGFLPEEVVVITSSNGILLCRSIFEHYGSNHCSRERMKIRYKVILYVCNPFTKEWITLKPRGKYINGCCYGFAYNAFGSVGSPNFEVVMVQPPLQLGKDPFKFKIYTSTTGTWRTSKEVCTLPDRLLSHQCCFTNGVFYWLTAGHTILAFDLKEERSRVIKLPGNAMVTHKPGEGVCLGVSEANLHFISLTVVELMVWILEHDNLRPKWSVKHNKPQVEMLHPLLRGCDRRPSYLPFCPDIPNRNMHPYAFQDDILYMRMSWSMFSYNIKTGEYEEEELCSCSKLDAATAIATGTPIVVPYCKSLLRVQAN